MTHGFSRIRGKKHGFDVEARQLANELRTILDIKALKNVRLVNRYDVEGISEELFAQATPTVFSEPQVDNVSADLPDFWHGHRVRSGISAWTVRTACRFRQRMHPADFAG